MAKRKSLGRGLDALLGQTRPATDDNTPPQVPADAADGLREVPIDLLQRGSMQPRHDMRVDALEDLASSIREQGIVQPLVVRPIGDGRYEIVAGERRWRAAQIVGLHNVPVIVRKLSDADAAAIAIIENIQRADLNPMEQAQGLLRLKDEHNMTHQDVADAVGKSRAAVTNLLRLLELDIAVRKMVEQRQLDMGHARALLGLSGRAQVDAAKQVVAKGLSVRATERLVKQLGAPPKARPASSGSVDPDVQRLENRLSETLGAKVSVTHGKNGKGKVLITYNSLDELDGIIAHIK